VEISASASVGIRVRNFCIRAYVKSHCHFSRADMYARTKKEKQKKEGKKKGKKRGGKKKQRKKGIVKSTRLQFRTIRDAFARCNAPDSSNGEQILVSFSRSRRHRFNFRRERRGKGDREGEGEGEGERGTFLAFAFVSSRFASPSRFNN